AAAAVNTLFIAEPPSLTGAALSRATSSNRTLPSDATITKGAVWRANQFAEGVMRVACRCYATVIVDATGKFWRSPPGTRWLRVNDRTFKRTQRRYVGKRPRIVAAGVGGWTSRRLALGLPGRKPLLVTQP